MKISYKTDRGLVRPDNQDEYAVKEYGDGSLLVAVADGVSGQPGGGMAASIARQCVLDFAPEPSDLSPQLASLLHGCDRKILQAAEEQPRYEHMATTLSVAFIREKTVYWAHVGDCRIYLCRKDTCTQITADDTLAAYLLATGRLTKEQARKDPSRHGLFEVVGRGDLELQNGRFAVQPGDLLLLSSDGLHDEISEEAMRDIALADLTLDGKIERLVDAAKGEGGSDNITVIGVAL